MYFPDDRLGFGVCDGDARPEGRRTHDACVIAVAVGRQRPVQRVEVGRTYTRLHMGTHWLKYVTPTALVRQLTAYDQGGAFLPGDYALTPVPVRRRTRQPGKNGPRSGKPAERTSRPADPSAIRPPLG